MLRECMICLEETVDFIEFSCKHEVCAQCFPKILVANPECPLCRTRLYVAQPTERHCGCCAGLFLVGLLGYILFIVERYTFM
jgi:hypothetical protein